MAPTPFREQKERKQLFVMHTHQAYTEAYKQEHTNGCVVQVVSILGTRILHNVLNSHLHTRANGFTSIPPLTTASP